MPVIVVWGRPMPKGSFRAVPRRYGGGTYLKPMSSGEPAWSEQVAWAAKAAHLVLIPRPLAVKIAIEFFFPRPQAHGWAIKRGELVPTRPTTPPDLDKLVRSVLDALTGIVYDDDKQVVSITASKHYADRPHARILVGEELS